MVEFPNLLYLKTRLGGLLRERKVGRTNMGSLLLHLVQKIRQVVGCVKIGHKGDDVAALAHAEIEPTVHRGVHLERCLALVSQR